MIHKNKKRQPDAKNQLDAGMKNTSTEPSPRPALETLPTTRDTNGGWETQADSRAKKSPRHAGAF
jgi:hypothetical protein